MKSKSTITIDDEVLHVDPQLVFQRLLATVKGGNVLELEESFKSTVPASLFGDDFLMREANKPQLGDAILKFTGPGRDSLPENVSFVLDGGWLLYFLQTGEKVPRLMPFAKFISSTSFAIMEEIQLWYLMGRTNWLQQKTTHLRRTKGRKGKEVRFNRQVKLSMK